MLAYVLRRLHVPRGIYFYWIDRSETQDLTDVNLAITFVPQGLWFPGNEDFNFIFDKTFFNYSIRRKIREQISAKTRPEETLVRIADSCADSLTSIVEHEAGKIDTSFVEPLFFFPPFPKPLMYPIEQALRHELITRLPTEQGLHILVWEGKPYLNIPLVPTYQTESEVREASSPKLVVVTKNGDKVHLPRNRCGDMTHPRVILLPRALFLELYHKRDIKIPYSALDPDGEHEAFSPSQPATYKIYSRCGTCRFNLG